MKARELPEVFPWNVKVEVNEKIFIRDPQQTELGRKILVTGVKMIDRLGLEEFTFKKLATELHTNESSLYRYFESKHKLLLYLFQWYWRWMEYQLALNLQTVSDPLAKIDILINLLMMRVENVKSDAKGIDKITLHRIVVKEASKAYLTRHVYKDNRNQFFKPYKDFCGRMAKVILEYNPNYPFARSLSSTVIEMSHYQTYFMNNLPSLTDFGVAKNNEQVVAFLKHLILSSVKPK